MRQASFQERGFLLASWREVSLIFFSSWTGCISWTPHFGFGFLLFWSIAWHYLLGIFLGCSDTTEGRFAPLGQQRGGLWGTNCFLDGPPCSWVWLAGLMDLVLFFVLGSNSSSVIILHRTGEQVLDGLRGIPNNYSFSSVYVLCYYFCPCLICMDCPYILQFCDALLSGSR